MELYASLSVLSILARDEEVKGRNKRTPAHLEPQVQQVLKNSLLQAGISCDSCGGYIPRPLGRKKGMSPPAMPCENERYPEGSVSRFVHFKIFQAQGGRPCLDLEASGQTEPVFADFSLSHSREALAVFVACGSSSSFWLGCDIECIDSRKDRQGIAKRFFSRQEYDWIYRDGDSCQGRRRFTMIWTAKEAWLKAHGLSVFDISRTPVFSMEPKSQASSLQFRQFFLQSPGGKDYVLALAAPLSLSFDDLGLQLADGWRLSSCEQIYPAESPASTVRPKM